MSTSVERAAVLRSRLHHHGLLGDRAARGDLDVAPLGLPDVDHGGAAAALAVRTDLGPDTLARLVDAGRVVPTYGARAAGALARPDDVPYVSHALLDPDPSADAALVDQLGRAALPPLREHGPMTKEQLGQAVAPDTPPRAMRSCQRCGRRHPDDGLVKRLAWSGHLRIEASDRDTDRVAAAGRWRPARYRRVRDDARVQLVRRFLRLHGPATVDDLAAWAGVDDTYASSCWSLVADELQPVAAPHGDGWVHAQDLDLLRDPPPLSRPRLVPGHDPLLQTRDRFSLVSDRAQQREIWRATANPGVIIADDQVIGTWRARTRRDRLEVRLRSFGQQLPMTELEADALAFAHARGLRDATMAVEDWCDHVGTHRPAPLTTLATMAQATSTLRLGRLVLSPRPANPVHLASEIATLDRLSGGRIELGLGAGHTPQDHAATGTWTPSGPTRRRHARRRDHRHPPAPAPCRQPRDGRFAATPRSASRTRW